MKPADRLNAALKVEPKVTAAYPHWHETPEGVMWRIVETLYVTPTLWYQIERMDESGEWSVVSAPSTNKEETRTNARAKVIRTQLPHRVREFLLPEGMDIIPQPRQFLGVPRG